MVKNLDHDYESEHPGLLGYLYTPIHILGGWKGVLGIAVAITIFYGVIVYTITTSRKRRDAAKKLKKKQ